MNQRKYEFMPGDVITRWGFGSGTYCQYECGLILRCIKPERFSVLWQRDAIPRDEWLYTMYDIKRIAYAGDME